jgi:hypothetical protein
MIETAIVLALNFAVQAPEVAPSSSAGASPPEESDADGSALPPEAKPHNDRGVALIVAGQYDEGIAELERAYARMPDPLKYRAARDKVLGSLRSAMMRRYETTGEPVHLCRLRATLQRHRAALLAALGPTGSTAAVAGTVDAIREVDATLGQRTCDPPPTARDEPTPTPTPTRQPARRGQGMRIAGGALMGVGFAALGVMTFGIVALVDNQHKLRSHTLAELDTAEPATPESQAEATRLYERADDRRTLAIVTGALGGATFVTGLVLRVVGQRRAARALASAPLRPAFAPTFVGLVGRLAF